MFKVLLINTKPKCLPNLLNRPNFSLASSVNIEKDTNDNSAQELSIQCREIYEYGVKPICIVCREVRIRSPVMLFVFLKITIFEDFRNVSLVYCYEKRIKYYFNMNDY